MMPVGEGNFFRNRYNSTIAFGVAVLLFLLPFAEIRCNGTPVARNTGIGLAVGNDYSLAGDAKSLRDSFGNHREDNERGPAKGSGKLYFLALAALLLGIAGVALSFIRVRTLLLNTIIGALAALLLIGLMFQLTEEAREKSSHSKSELSDPLHVSMHFTIWYYLAVLSFLAAAFFSYRYGQLQNTETPPSGAPQLDLDNPGEQSEFPKSASESEIG